MARKRVYFDVAICHPNLMGDWDYNKNNSLMVYTTGEYFWLCSSGHSYKSTISARRRGRGCPTCNRFYYKLGETDLETVNPNLASEWNFKKNIVSPADVYYKANEKYWWVCHLNHEWQDTVNHRSNGNRNCPYCSGRRIMSGFNDLLTNNPELSKEWNYSRNKFGPDEVLKFSNKKAWWVCAKGHEWQAPISNRVQGRDCKKCSHTGTSSEERLLQIIFQTLNFKVENNARILKTPFNSYRELDIYLPEEKIGVEFNGWRWHCEKCTPKNRKSHALKEELCQKNAIELIVIWSDDWSKSPLTVLRDINNIIFLKNSELKNKYSYSVKSSTCCKKVKVNYPVKRFLGEDEDKYESFAKFLIENLANGTYLHYNLTELLKIYTK